MPAALFVLLLGLPPPPWSRRPLPRPRPVIPALSRRPPLARRWKPLFRNGKLVPPLGRRALWWHCRERAPARRTAFSSAFSWRARKARALAQGTGVRERQILGFLLEFIRVHQLLCSNGRIRSSVLEPVRGKYGSAEPWSLPLALADRYLYRSVRFADSFRDSFKTLNELKAFFFFVSGILR